MVLSSRTDPRRRASRRMRSDASAATSSRTATGPSTSTTATPGTSRTQPASAAAPDGPGATTRRWRVRPRCRRSAHPAVGHDPPRRQHDEVVADPLHEVELVRREEDRHAPRGLLAHEVGHRVDGVRVEAGERLVEDQRDRGGHDRRGDLDALLVAQRERLEGVVRALGEAEPLEEAPGPPGARRRRSSRAAGPGRPAGRAPAASGRARAPPACSRTGRGRPASPDGPSSTPRPPSGRGCP